MFEKEAEEWVKTKGTDAMTCLKENIGWDDVCKQAFKDGAEFGYNKANEWHYVKDGLPELYKDVLVVFPRGDCDVKRLTNHNEWVGRGSWCSLTDVIAWKEIVLPEIKESE